MYHRNIIQKWIAQGEGPNLDFKQSITSAPKIARSIVAFANSRGGNIVVGIGDHGHIVGIDPNEEKYELDKAASKYCSPSISLEYDLYEMYGKTILITQVAESTHKPHYAIKKNGTQKIYVRVGDSCIVPNEMVNAVLQKGDLNNLHRNTQYGTLKKKLIDYLKEHQQISIAHFMQLNNCNERSAKRTLIDFMFEGFILMINESTFKLK